MVGAIIKAGDTLVTTIREAKDIYEIRVPDVLTNKVSIKTNTWFNLREVEIYGDRVGAEEEIDLSSSSHYSPDGHESSDDVEQELAENYELVSNFYYLFAMGAVCVVAFAIGNYMGSYYKKKDYYEQLNDGSSTMELE